MMQIFTERGKKVKILAGEEAIRLGHDRIDTHHLLLGLTKEGQGVGANVLRNCGVAYDRVFKAIESTPVHLKPISDSQLRYTFRKEILPHTTQMDETFLFAAENATKLNDNYIGTEHLLLGLCDQPDSSAAQILHTLQVELESVRDDTLVLLGAIPPVPRAAREGLESIFIALRVIHSLSDEKILAMTMDEVRALLERS